MAFNHSCFMTTKKQQTLSFKSLLFISISVWLVSFSACGSKSGNVIINGVIEGKPNAWILIRETSDNRITTIDSTNTTDSGVFKFDLKIESPKFLLIQVEEEFEPIVLLAEPGEELQINGKSGGLARNYHVSGSKGSALVRQLNFRLNQTVHVIDSLSLHFRESREHPRFDSIKVGIDSLYNRIIEDHRQFTIHFINENRFNISSILALYQQFDSKRQVLNKREDFLLFQLVDSSLYPLYPENHLVKTFHSNVVKMVAQLDLYDKRSDMLLADSVLPFLEFPLITGDTITLYDIKARYILIDFWASWCNTCIPQSVSYIPVYKEFKSKGFEILQFSVDESSREIKRIIERDSLNWMHAVDYKVWESNILESLHINSVPANYLVDRNGVVKATNLNSKALREELVKLLP